MCPSTPPPPDASIAAAYAASRPVLQNPPRPPPPPNPHPFYSPPPSSLPSNPNPNCHQLAPRPPHPHDPPHFMYPVASSGRGFVSRPLPVPAAGSSPRPPPFVLPYFEPGQGNPAFFRPNHLPHVLFGSGPGPAGNASGVVRGISASPLHHPKAAPPSTSISDKNGHNSLRDRNRDDTLAVVKDRKVRITDNASLYALCRSWLRSGFLEETQKPPYLDTVKSLPRPLPVAAQGVDSPDKVENKEDEDEEEGSIENLSEKELLQRHIKRAKRVRSRLREERLQRITRYKTRLALLLPPMVEQQFKTESAEAN
ncbi:hydroxyproline-rich glycoprotein [Striga asiatica]|uniref:Hydroxyproline-rich glycoprotein n=1 Tax=Striga asiatica TaxID=4170 RepID=A0A5A7RJP1_STRAF|nr:hydroxyproline-rich glycoprotein [Striga asiatica]